MNSAKLLRTTYLCRAPTVATSGNGIISSLQLMPNSYLPKNICFICFIESSLKMMENTFYFILTFCSCRKNGLIGKIRLISKFMASQSV